MPYIKSTLVGMVTFVIVTIAYGICAIYLAMRHFTPPPGVEVGFDLRRAIFASSLYWIIAIAAFALGFYWEFRRA
jgi:hypothetical protein